MYKIKTPEYETLLSVCYEVRQPLFIEGGPGIGKSAIPRQIFPQIAAKEDRIYAEWSDLSLAQKNECLKTPEKYWIFADMRTSQMDTTSLVGIPNMANTEMLENIPYSWVVYFTHPGAHGCIFFDEINLAAPIVQSITYSAIHDRVISDRRIAERVYVFAAGNRSQDKAHTFDMPLPLRDRFAECEIGIDVDHWIKWASNNNINSHLISFINWKPANLYNADKAKAEKPATPRGVERASRLLNGYNIADKKSHMLVSISCGESFATEFQAYVTVFKQLNWDTIFANPASVKNMPLDQQYAISAGVTDQFKRNQGDIKQLDKVLDVTDNLREDFAVFSYRMMSSSDRKAFKEIMSKLNRSKVFATKYGKFLLDNINDKI